jgi:putative transposase
MPWSETSPMDQRIQFIADYQRGVFTMTELCGRFGISRKTGYKWLTRYEDEGPEGLLERSRRPRTCPHETPLRIELALIEARRHHPTWGAKKLLSIIGRRHRQWRLPAPSTASLILKRHGLISPRRRRARPGHPGRPHTPMTAPNEIWSGDFKGHFRTRNGLYCYPLTVADGFSRFLLACKALPAPAHEGTRAGFLRLFREYGLPHIIRTDNGAPFATTAIGRLSRLSVWWIRLGIFPELIEPGHPEQNGRHERMHRTLKAETTRPPAPTRSSQQLRFNRFRREFNNDRPHEALGQETPASFYHPSTRSLPRRLPPTEYPGHYEVRLVSNNGGIRWNSNWVNVSQVLAQEFVGLEEIDNGLWDVYFGPLKLGRLDERDHKIEDALGRKCRKKPSPMYPD